MIKKLYLDDKDLESFMRKPLPYFSVCFPLVRGENTEIMAKNRPNVSGEVPRMQLCFSEMKKGGCGTCLYALPATSVKEESAADDAGSRKAANNASNGLTSKLGLGLIESSSSIGTS